MDGLEAIGTKIRNFPGYGTLEARRASDELVRSYVGEALALLNERHSDFFAQRPEVYEALLLRSGFMNQAAFHAFEYAGGSETRQQAMAEADVALLTIADAAARVASADVGRYVDDLTAAFDKRDKAMASG
jgi:hypothetical protein